MIFFLYFYPHFCSNFLMTFFLLPLFCSPQLFSNFFFFFFCPLFFFFFFFFFGPFVFRFFDFRFFKLECRLLLFTEIFGAAPICFQQHYFLWSGVKRLVYFFDIV